KLRSPPSWQAHRGNRPPRYGEKRYGTTRFAPFNVSLGHCHGTGFCSRRTVREGSCPSLPWKRQRCFGLYHSATRDLLSRSNVSEKGTQSPPHGNSFVRTGCRF